MREVPEIDLADAAVVADPFAAAGRARGAGAMAKVLATGFGNYWVTTRHDTAREVLTDPRFAINSGSFMLPPGIPEHCQQYMRTMSEMDGPDHQRLRRLVSPAFTPRRAAQFRPRIEPIVDRLLDALPAHVEDGAVDLLRHFARPLPMEVICELVGIPEAERGPWRECGAAAAAGNPAAFAAAIPAVLAGAEAVVARRKAEPAAGAGEVDLLADLVRSQADDGDRLSDREMVTLIWHLVLAGQTPTNFIANAVQALLDHPDQLAALRAEPALLPGAVEELMRWCGPVLMAVPRFAQEDVEIAGVAVAKGEPVSAGVAAGNRDPGVFADPDRLDVRRRPGGAQLGFGHGPHFCLGASLARVECEVALGAVLRRFPRLAAAGPAERAPDPGTWRLNSLPVAL